MVRWAYEVAITQVRQNVVAFERGVVIGIETVQHRQAMPFKKALAEAKSMVKAMADKEVCVYTVYWFCQEAVQAVAVQVSAWYRMSWRTCR